MKDDRNTQQEIMSYLLKETNEVVQEKAAVWNNIKNELFVKQKKKRKKQRFFIVLGMALLLAFVWAGMMTTPGQALVSGLKEIFVDEKKVDIHIEGDKEETDLGVELNEELKYVIYIDHSRYKMVKGETRDKIVLLEELDESYPEVGMEIWQENVPQDEVVARIEKEMAAQHMTVKRIEKVDVPLEAMRLMAYGEKDEQNYKWDTPIFKYYITDDINGQLFVIKQMYFLEAAEGHAVRFDSMLEEFQIISEN